MSGERISVWDDPNVKDAFNSGRTADDICVLNCPICGQISYYNQGSSFFCRHCDKGFYVRSDDEDPAEIVGTYVNINCTLTMADVAAAECEDYP